MSSSFTHLHVHSEFSLIDSIVRIKPLIEHCAKLGMKSVALTDQANIFAAVKFYRTAIKAGIKPIIGAEIWLENIENKLHPYRLVLLCQNDKGYKNLVALISRAYVKGQSQGLAIVKKAWLDHHTDGLIALSSGLAGDVGQAIVSGDIDLAKRLLLFWQQQFPQRFYLEIQRIGHANEETYIKAAINLAIENQLPLVATNNVRFLQSEDFEAHEARVCIQQGGLLNDQRRTRHYTEQQYLRSQEQMLALFADVPQALQNSAEIAKRCNLVLTFDKKCLPIFPLPTKVSVENHLTTTATTGLQSRLKGLKLSSQKYHSYQQRLTFELGVIANMGFCSYFLIVADFIRWAKAHDVPVGPGRGSGAGSLVAYAIGITDIDPLRYDLLFERFLNPQRISMPDFDIDFCITGRDRVIDYVAQKYGRESVVQIITFGTMAARAVVRDVGRVLGFPYGFVDEIAKLIPFAPGMTLAKALRENDLKHRYQKDDDVRTIIDLAQSLEGIARNAGTHAGGVVIAPGKITNFTALYCEPNGESLVSQFDKDDIEAIGLVKFDFLGLRNLTIINRALHIINDNRNRQKLALLDMAHIALDDKKTYQLLRECKTTAVFQLESRGMGELVKKLQPSNFEDIVPLVALFRPGPLQSGMVDDFIARRRGQASIEYLHPKLAPLLKSTYGVILYQEQVMQIAQLLAGYSLGHADLLRSAMGKKKPEEMAKQRAMFIAGATDRGIKADIAGRIFDLMEKFAGYGFNKSHSVAYGLITYQTAYLKANYPAQFMAAVLSADMEQTDKVLRLVTEVKAIGLTMLAPDINFSDYAFTVSSDGNIIYGLGAIKSVGEAAIKSLLHNRSQQGPFKDLLDFCCRNDLRKINKRIIEALIKSGAMDKLGQHRAKMLAQLPKIMQIAEQQLQHQNQHDLFGDVNTASHQQLSSQTVKPWSNFERLQAEKQTLGLYLSGHPIDSYREELARLISCQLKDLKQRSPSLVIVAGLIVGIRTIINKRGERLAFITLDDNTDRMEITIPADNYKNHQSLLQPHHIVVVEGELSLDRFNDRYRLTAKCLFNMEQARIRFAKCLLLTLVSQQIPATIASLLAQVLKAADGNRHCQVKIIYCHPQCQALIALSANWHVTPTDKLLAKLRTILSYDNVIINY